MSTTLAMTAPTSLQTLSPEGSTSIIGGVIGGVVGGVIVAVVLVIICVVVVMLKRRPSWKPEEPTTDAIGYTNGGMYSGSRPFYVPHRPFYFAHLSVCHYTWLTFPPTSSSTLPGPKKNSKSV